MRIQLWSYNYDPEPTGIGPLSATVARALSERGHSVEVIAAHPHYPEASWGVRLRPYREVREGVSVLRVPIWPGRRTTAQRIRQELSYVAGLVLATPRISKPDVILAVSPSFPGLGPVIAHARARRVPWVLWLQDILPDGATVTGALREGRLVNLARRFERYAYRSAARIIVISDSCRDNLIAKGVPPTKIIRVFNPASRPIRREPRPDSGIDTRAVLNMGNIGRTQNLRAIVSAFEDDQGLAALGARLTLAGDGLAADGVRAAIRTDRVRITGVLGFDPLEELLLSAAVGLVSQSYEGVDFNVPSKLMNFMAYGLPVVAAARPDSEVARLVERSGAGWVTESAEQCAAMLAEVLSDQTARSERGAAGLAFAQREFAPEVVAGRIEGALRAVL